MLRVVFLLICHLPFALLYADFSHTKVENVYLVETIILFLWGFWPWYHATSCILTSTVDRISILGCPWLTDPPEIRLAATFSTKTYIKIGFLRSVSI